MKKNKGLTLVELIVVISIIGILLGILIPSLNQLLGYEARKATEKLTASLDDVRIQAMSRLVGEMRLYNKDGCYYIEEFYHNGKSVVLFENWEPEDDKRREIGNRRITISYRTDASGGWQEISDGEEIILTYDRASGGFRPLQERIVASGDIDAATLKVTFPDKMDGAKGIYCTEIRIVGGSRTSIITLHPKTGKYETRGEVSP